MTLRTSCLLPLLFGCAQTSLDTASVDVDATLGATDATKRRDGDLERWLVHLSPDQQDEAADLLLDPARFVDADGQALDGYGLRAAERAVADELTWVAGEVGVQAWPSTPAAGDVTSRPQRPGEAIQIDEVAAPPPGAGSTWSDYTLTYCFDAYRDSLSNNSQRTKWDSATDEMAAHTPLSFSRTTSCGSADIRIDKHGKNGERDNCGGMGSSSTLAHAQYPHGTNSDVYVHYTKGKELTNVDNASWWDENFGPSQFDYESLTLHELGHNVGLGHDSAHSGSVMYPSMSAFDKNRSFNSHDIDALEDLYGSSSCGSSMTAGGAGLSALEAARLGVDDGDLADELGMLAQRLGQAEIVARDASIAGPGTEHAVVTTVVYTEAAADLWTLVDEAGVSPEAAALLEAAAILLDEAALDAEVCALGG